MSLVKDIEALLKEAKRCYNIHKIVGIKQDEENMLKGYFRALKDVLQIIKYRMKENKDLANSQIEIDKLLEKIFPFKGDKNE